MNKKKSVEGVLRVRTYEILQRAVEEGFHRGWRQAHKHIDDPTDDHIEDQVISAIMGEICDVFKFDDE